MTLSPGFTVLKKTPVFRILKYYFLLSLAHSSIIAVLPVVDAGLLMASQTDPAIACWHCVAFYCGTDFVSTTRNCICCCCTCPTLNCGSSYCVPVSYWQFMSCCLLMRRVISLNTVQEIIFVWRLSQTWKIIPELEFYFIYLFFNIFFLEKTFFEIFLIVKNRWKYSFWIKETFSSISNIVFGFQCRYF